MLAVNNGRSSGEDETEDDILEKLGYKQELKRSFGVLGMIGFSFNIVSSWSALAGVLIIGVQSGGPPVMIYSWLGVCTLTLTVAYSMAAMSATVNFFVANFALGMATLSYPEYVIERWHVVLLTWLVMLFSVTLNIFSRKLFDRLSTYILFWNIISLIAILITILTTNQDKKPARFVFSDFQNFTGFGASYAAIIGLLQSCFGMCCYDAPAHMTGKILPTTICRHPKSSTQADKVIEEMKNASKDAPKAIVTSVYIGAVTGFAFLIAVSFCIGDVEATAKSVTGVPFIQILYDSTHSVVGTCFLTSMVLFATFVGTTFLTAESSRTLYAFARDNGLPFSRVFAKVAAKQQVPINAVLLSGLVQLILNAIYFGTLTGFNTVIAIATEAFYLSYAMPILARILAFVTGRVQHLPGPYSLGRYSIATNLVGLIFLTFCAVTFNFPTLAPVEKDNMNYTSAALGVIGLISLVNWITTGRKKFKGPQITKGDAPVLAPGTYTGRLSNSIYNEAKV
ncbi:uncharacterized protein KY384_003020 [Bacidia gigantensis]|uniref:uncharacterized protein n=1 Tax=Bacidia gigantensis TaxID=2732470 RepID=UPI001D048082|nr:uncharacterized protein KY384_003020 [Bacidia gigantensis]KAG8531391.1 hypothetical protein KY384_003020 [Bacidia gigantensis]